MNRLISLQITDSVYRLTVLSMVLSLADNSEAVSNETDDCINKSGQTHPASDPPMPAFTRTDTGRQNNVNSLKSGNESSYTAKMYSFLCNSGQSSSTGAPEHELLRNVWGHCLSIRSSPVIFLLNNVFTHECFEKCSTFNGSVCGCVIISWISNGNCRIYKQSEIVKYGGGGN